QAGVNPSTAASAEATGDRAQSREALEKRAAKVSAAAKARAETRLEAAASSVEKQAGQGEARVASRLAAEFGTTSQAMMDEKNELKASWGNLMIAYTLASNTSGMSVVQLMELKSGGMGWGQIAAGLGLDLGSAVSAVKSEARVANGAAHADGHVAVIHGEGSREGMDAHAGTHAGLEAGHDRLRFGAGAGGGVRIGR